MLSDSGMEIPFCPCRLDSHDWAAGLSFYGVQQGARGLLLLAL